MILNPLLNRNYLVQYQLANFQHHRLELDQPDFYLVKKQAVATAGTIKTTTFSFGAAEKFPMIDPQIRLYDIANQIKYFAQTSARKQDSTSLMPMLVNYQLALEKAQGIEGLDRAEFDAAELVLHKLLDNHRIRFRRN